MSVITSSFCEIHISIVVKIVLRESVTVRDLK